MRTHQPNVLDLVVHSVKESLAANRTPVVIFDLDETTINSRERVLRLLRDFALQPALQSQFPHETSTLLEATGGEQANRAAVRSTMTALGYNLRAYPLYLDDILKELNAYCPAFAMAIGETSFRNKYLSNEYCIDDVPMPGAAAFVNRVQQAGAMIVYLTGRNQPGMGHGSAVNLLRNGFPLGEEKGAALVMKPNADFEDTEFKKQALTGIAAMGEVVGGFENEPSNSNAFLKAFPKGIHGFVDSTHSNNPEVLSPGMFWIKNFLGIDP